MQFNLSVVLTLEIFADKTALQEAKEHVELYTLLRSALEDPASCKAFVGMEKVPASLSKGKGCEWQENYRTWDVESIFWAESKECHINDGKPRISRSWHFLVQKHGALDHDVLAQYAMNCGEENQGRDGCTKAKLDAAQAYLEGMRVQEHFGGLVSPIAFPGAG